MPQSPPNLVLVSIDSLRADHCGYVGDDRGLTPTMDALADDGVAFTQAIAPGPQTFSSMPVAFTGEYRPPNSLESVDASSHWARRMGAIENHITRFETLPERLQRRGYTTIGFSPNPWTSTVSGFDRGFDHFVDFSQASGDSERLRDRVATRVLGENPDRKAFELAKDMVTGSSFFAQWGSFYDDVLAAVADAPEPFFLWVFLMDTHFPFVTTREHRVEQSALGMYYSTLASQGAMRGTDDSMPARAIGTTKRSYRDTVRAADAFLDAIQQDLAHANPVTVVHSDHGESFGDHGNFGHHHREVYEENVHVPYLVHGLDRAGRVDEPTSLASIPRVLTEIADAGTFDPEPSGDAVVAASEAGEHVAVRDDRFKLVRSDDQVVLYDLDVDPEETTDVSADHKAVRHRLERVLRTHDDHVAETGRLDAATRVVAARGDL
ncbi:sulfatase [Halorubellus sp. PRR65]|uniref:sulfatase n=1 Tax=Halorubellus sp. PRR65 TaxID=3098148 RepID=UPI002B258F25|nr:sulfatase [Halorubellus sp. PRR65]